MNNNINEWSYQRYARFYGTEEFKDDDFISKINTIKKLIVEDHQIEEALIKVLNKNK